MVTFFFDDFSFIRNNRNRTVFGHCNSSCYETGSPAWERQSSSQEVWGSSAAIW